MRWLWIFACLGFCLGYFVEGRNNAKFKKTHHGKSLEEITINLMVHYDIMLTKQLKHKTGLKQVKTMTKTIIKDVEDLFRDPQLHVKVNLRLLETKFLKSRQNYKVSADASKYLRSYCEWQKEMKLLKNKQYYSVLFTGLDLYVVNSTGSKVRESVARAYRNGICNVEKSCALFEWKPNDIVHLLAHEIGHSLGIKHDQEQSHIRCKTGIMTTRYTKKQRYKKHNGWSICNGIDLKLFLASKKTDCLRNNP